MKSILKILDVQNDEKILKFPHRNLSLLYVGTLFSPSHLKKYVEFIWYDQNWYISNRVRDNLIYAFDSRCHFVLQRRTSFLET